MGREQANKILLEAAAFGNEMALRKALEDGAEIEAQDERGWSALSLAAWKGHASCVKKLIKEGAALEPKGGGRAPALHWAARRGREKIVGMLLEAGADANARDEIGRTALRFAMPEDVTAGALRLLLRFGADPNAKDNQGRTALMLACERGDRDSAELLANAGADLLAKDSSGWGLEDYARGVMSQPRAIVAWIEERKAAEEERGELEKTAQGTRAESRFRL